jgi:hypothetical protein
MFDLEQAFANWRTHMLVSGIKAPVPLDELEGHLRDDLERQIKSGINPQAAFENSVQQMGHAGELKGEFKKTCETGRNRRGQFLRMGVIGLTGTPVMNLLGLFLFHRSSSVFFSDQWWSDWFPCYCIWTTFTLVGLVGGLANWKWLKVAGE